MTPDPIRYSSIRREPAYKPADGYTMNAFYDLLIKPHTVVLTLVGYFAAINQDLLPYVDGATRGDERSIAHLLLILLSLLAGFRLIQSLYLAKRDYAHLEHGSADILIFLAVAAFASGAAVKLLRNNLVAVLSIYSVCAAVGTANFFTLYKGRIPNSDDFDYPVDRRIQAVNTAVFAGLTALLVSAAIAAHHQTFRTLYWLIAASYALIVVNIVHSEQLTMLPKFLLHNEPDSVSNTLKAFRSSFGYVAALKTDEEIVGALFQRADTGYRSIKTSRARRRDAGRICAELLRAFPYIFKYVFDTDDKAKLGRVLRALITAAGGFGALGYMRFYFIVNDQGEEVGLFKIDTEHHNWLYQLVAAAALPFTVMSSLRTLRILKVWKRAKRGLSAQASPGRKELRLTYVIIFAEHRGRSYGRSFMRMLQNALLHNNTNDIQVDRITLFVRERNLAARRLFEGAGFCYPKTGLPNDSDPFADVKAIGKPMFMERRRQ